MTYEINPGTGAYEQQPAPCSPLNVCPHASRYSARYPITKERCEIERLHGCNCEKFSRGEARKWSTLAIVHEVCTTEPQLLTVKEVAALLDWTTSYVSLMARKGRIPVKTLQKMQFFCWDDVCAYAQRRHLRKLTEEDFQHILQQREEVFKRLE